MKLPSRLIAALLLISAVPAFAADTGAASPVALAPESRLWLVGDSTLHAYSVVAEKVDVAVAADPGAPLHAAMREGKMKALSVRVPVAQLRSGKGGLDKRMHRALKLEENPEISFQMTDYTVEPSTTVGRFTVRANGSLTVAGKVKSIDLVGEVTPGETVRIQGKEEVLMTDHGVKPPVFMGTIRAHDRVVVNYDLYLKP